MWAKDGTGDGHCLSLVRKFDFDRYLSLLYTGGAARDGLAALYAFNMEIARAREIVSDPMPGEIRFQWWRDTLEAPAGADVDQHPVAGAIRQTIAANSLPLAPFVNLIDARVFDLYDDPMQTLGDLEGYAGETSSVLIQLAAMILCQGRDPGTAEAAGHAGVAYAITGLLRALPWHARRRQLYLPGDVLDAHGVDREQVFAGKTTPALKAAVADLVAIARGHLDELRQRIGDVPREAIPAFLPVCLTEPLLSRIEKRGEDPLNTVVDLSPLSKHWILWRSWHRARKGCRSSIA